MGGKNHQPCRAYLLNSTKLSKHLSLAYAHLELSNVALEDILISELAPERDNQSSGFIYPVLMHELSISAQELQNAHEALGRLRTQMETEDFVDLPSLQRLDLDAIGEVLGSQGLVDRKAWVQAMKIMRRGGFFGMTRRFEADIIDLLELNRALQIKFQQLEETINQGNLSMVTEENRYGNFKAEFAAHYTKWITFNGLFLASSLLSTELWYAFTGKGTLASADCQVKVA
ncbi:MAG: hypothetical protein ACSLEX_04220 [Minisyncoccota bacterium]